jgi:VanZ family protein
MRVNPISKYEKDADWGGLLKMAKRTAERSLKYMNRWLLVLPLMIAGTLLFFMPDRAHPGSVVSQLYGFAHLLFFALMARVLAGLMGGPERLFGRQAVLIMLVILGAGGAIELIQPFFGRSTSWQDLGVDLLGGLLGLIFWVPARRELPPRLLVCAQVFALIVASVVFCKPAFTLWDIWQASRQFPVLSDFETRLEAERWSSGAIDTRVARNGKRSLNVLLKTGKYSGTTLQRSFGDWRGYTTLAFSLYNPDPQPLSIIVSIRDWEHFRRGGEFDDRFNRTFWINKGWNDIAIPVADIENAPAERKLELNRLSEMVIFTMALPEPRRIYLDHVRLVR